MVYAYKYVHIVYVYITIYNIQIDIISDSHFHWFHVDTYKNIDIDIDFMSDYHFHWFHVDTPPVDIHIYIDIIYNIYIYK